ncbi:MAG: hypothetical protein ACLU80_00415 [Dorea sp.]
MPQASYIRFVPDYAYIQTDPEKSRSRGSGATLCTVIGLPELAEGAAQEFYLHGLMVKQSWILER